MQFLYMQDIAGFKGKIPVAVKTLTSRDPEIIDKFREEAELMKKFSHPNIVSLLGEPHVTEYIIMYPLLHGSIYTRILMHSLLFLRCQLNESILMTNLQLITRLTF